jgi:hypothetical protein
MRSSVIAMIWSASSLSAAPNCSASQVRGQTRDRASAVLAVERHIAAGTVDVGDEQPGAAAA